MKKALITVAGLLAGAALLVCTAPAMAHGRVDFAISVGIPVAPMVYAPPPVYAAPPAYFPPPPVYVSPPVVYGAYGPVYGPYGPVVQIGWPYHYAHRHHGHRDAYRDWRR